MILTVMGVLETVKGLELTVQGKDITMTAIIPQEVLDPSANQFRAEMIDDNSLRIVYHAGREKKVYETPIKR